MLIPHTLKKGKNAHRKKGFGRNLLHSQYPFSYLFRLYLFMYEFFGNGLKISKNTAFFDTFSELLQNKYFLLILEL